MAIKSKQYFKDKFVTGYQITEQDYVDLIDSLRGATESVPLGDTTGLSAILSAYRKKSVDIPVADIDGLSAAIAAATANFLTTASVIDMSQVDGLRTAIANFVTSAQVSSMLHDITPTIDAQTGDWFVGDTDTGVPAEGATPVISDSKTWKIGGVDTGISIYPEVQVDYDDDIDKDDRPNMHPSKDYVLGSMKVWKNGTMLQKRADFREVDKSTIWIQTYSGEPLVFEYRVDS